MNYDIRLNISYDYGAPSDHARTLVRLLPSDVPGRQIVRSRLLTVDPIPSEMRETSDFFGNAMNVLAFHDPIDRIDLSLYARVEMVSKAPILDLSPDLRALLGEIESALSLDRMSPHHFLGPSVRIVEDPAISSFAQDLIAPGLTTMQIVEAVGTAIHNEMQFDAGVTHVNTPAAEAFANRHGVCQDFSHIMISALRTLGIPAGYVSGFLRTIPPPGQARLEGADAMHAWVSAWCGAEAGWIEYDPTNACTVGPDHIVVAYGRDYSDVSPIKGVLRTSGAQVTRHQVDVEPL